MNAVEVHTSEIWGVQLYKT